MWVHVERLFCGLYNFLGAKILYCETLFRSQLARNHSLLKMTFVLKYWVEESPRFEWWKPVSDGNLMKCSESSMVLADELLLIYDFIRKFVEKCKSRLHIFRVLWISPFFSWKCYFCRRLDHSLFAIVMLKCIKVYCHRIRKPSTFLFSWRIFRKMLLWTNNYFSMETGANVLVWSIAFANLGDISQRSDPALMWLFLTPNRGYCP